MSGERRYYTDAWTRGKVKQKDELVGIPGSIVFHPLGTHELFLSQDKGLARTW